MGTFLKVAFGTVVAIWTAAAFLMVIIGLAMEDWVPVRGGLALEALLVVPVATLWAAWQGGAAVVRWVKRPR